MSCRTIALLSAVFVTGLLLPSPAVAQPSTAEGDTQSRTWWGDPDLQGIWDFRSLTPMERPPELAGKAFLTDEEAAVFVQGLSYTNWDDRSNPEGEFGLDSDIEHGYNQFWMDFGTDLTADRRTSLVVEPADGRIPWLEDGTDRVATAMRSPEPHPPARRTDPWPNAASWGSTRVHP